MCFPFFSIEDDINMVNEDQVNLICGDSLEVLQHFEDNSIDSVVTDCPYGLSFMGKDWDKALPDVEIWKECIRVLKPGGYLVAMSGSRTYHRLAVQLEDLGLICHPMIGWLYGSGFPKATDLSKQFDKAAGAERDVIGVNESFSKRQNKKRIGKNFMDVTVKDGSFSNPHTVGQITAPATYLAKKWNGYKYGLQALKPALEPIAVFQKPHLKPMIKNVEKWGCGAMNIEKTRVKPLHAPLLPSTLDRAAFDTACVDIPESCRASFSCFCDLSLEQLHNFLRNIFSEHCFGSTSYTNLWRGVEHEYRTVRNQSLVSLCGNDLPVEHVISCDRDSTEWKDFQSGYPTLFHFCDGLIHATQENVLDVFPSTLDVLGDIFHYLDSNKNNHVNRNTPLHISFLVFSWSIYNIIKADVQGTYRHPANLVHDGSEVVEDEFLRQGGIRPIGGTQKNGTPIRNKAGKWDTMGGKHYDRVNPYNHGSDTGSASRFFNALPITQDDLVPFLYCAKASKRERNEGLEGMPEKLCGMMEDDNYPIKTGSGNVRETKRQNFHPTCKPIKLMEWLIKLVTPEGGITIDPFMGSGTTGIAAKRNGFRFIGIEKEKEYFEIAEKRINNIKGI